MLFHSGIIKISASIGANNVPKYGINNQKIKTRLL